MTGREVVVFGPAYLDRVLRVDRPLVGDDGGPPIDQSVEGEWKFTDGDVIEIASPDGSALEVVPPEGWPGPCGELRLRNPLRFGPGGRRRVRGITWSDDLGGMGAGYAAALGGLLYSALGAEDDPASQAVSRRLARQGVDHRPIRLIDRTADWTLLISSGEFGDKLPIGFRGCHDALPADELARRAGAPCDLLVVAALPNRLVEPILSAGRARTRFLAPAMRNMTDREHPLGPIADAVDLLCCNRTEWLALEGREFMAARVPIVAITDGPRGIDVRFADSSGEARRFHQPAFPRARPPRDTNRAGEAFASTFLSTLLDHGWEGMSPVVAEPLIRSAAERAAAAAALELDLAEFGFPTSDEIAAACRSGRVV